MSKLPKAPLIEVIFELRWTVDKDELKDVHYLYGDLYPSLKRDYPHREIANNLPADLLLNLPSHRFRTAANDYPLVQIGPGILTVNTIDQKYFWEDYEARILSVYDKFTSIYSLTPKHDVTLVLQYFDLFKVDLERVNIEQFLKTINIEVKQGIYKSDLKELALTMSFPTPNGLLTVNINKGHDNKLQSGFIIQTNLLFKTSNVDPTLLKNGLERHTELCSQSFKDMTRGELYNSFK